MKTPKRSNGGPALVPNNLREVRNTRGLTAFKLAQIIGCRETTIYRYEMGYKPSLIAKHALANALSVSVAELFPTTDEPQEAAVK